MYYIGKKKHIKMKVKIIAEVIYPLFYSVGLAS